MVTVFGCQQSFGQQKLVINYSNGGELNDEFQRKILSELPEDALMVSGEIIDLLTDGIQYLLVADPTASYYSLNREFAKQHATKSLGKESAITLDTFSATYYDYREKTIAYGISSKVKPQIVRESGFKHEYQPTGEIVSILGYTCVAIAVEFCGHPYTVYYTPEIPYPTGPSYFVGFPGLVLKVVSERSGRGYVAESVDVVDDSADSKNITISGISTFKLTEKEEYLSFKDYCNSQ